MTRHRTTATGTSYILRPTLRAQWAPIIREKRHEWPLAAFFIAGFACGLLALCEVLP